MKNIRIFILSGLVVLAISLVAIFVIVRTTRADRPLQSSNSNPYSSLIKGFQEQLADPNMSSTTKEKIQARINLLNQLMTQEAVGEQKSAPRNPSLNPTDAPVDQYIIPEGIEENPSPPYKQLDLEISNAWRKTIEKKRFLIYAGQLVVDPNQGAVMLFQNERNQFVIYRTPKAAGAVKIIDENNLILELQSKDGLVFYFDVLQEAYIVDGELIKVDPGTGEKPIEDSYPAP